MNENAGFRTMGGTLATDDQQEQSERKSETDHCFRGWSSFCNGNGSNWRKLGQEQFGAQKQVGLCES